MAMLRCKIISPFKDTDGTIRASGEILIPPDLAARLAEKRCVKILYDAPLPRESAEQMPAAPLVAEVTPAATLEPLSRRGRPKKHH